MTDEGGEPFSARYEDVNAMLLHERLKEHRKVEEQEIRTVKQQSELEALPTARREQAVQMQEMSEQVPPRPALTLFVASSNKSFEG